MKKLIILIQISLMSFLSFSESNNSIRPGEIVAEFHFFNVTDTQGFVESIDKFDSSDCAAEWRKVSGADVGLFSRSGSRQTHIILVTYDDFNKMQKGNQVMASCPAASDMGKSFDRTTVSGDYYNYITELLLEGGDWTQNSVFSNVEIKVDMGKESDYLDAWKKLVSSNSDDFGSFGINRVVFGNKYVSHMIFNGTDSLKDLNDSLKETYASNDFKSFNNRARNMRKHVNTTLAQAIKSYPAER